VSAKFNLWENFDSPESIARWINLLPKDPANPASYSFINVHPWSKSLEDVQRTINLFSEHVQVVTPEGFIKRIVANVPHGPSKVLKNPSSPGEEKLNINVYPNPTGIGQTGGVSETKIRLQTFNNKLPQHVRIVDILGRTVREWQLSGLFGKRVLDLSWDGYNQDGIPVPPGIYFVQAFQSMRVQTRKFIITRH
ncbi:MAG: T9SS type A sorting domain-containing protein, partial [Calditrichaeota bacterium]|nr:T9SS type A sorting domain-containing protein [Calditrichota bacterium]